MISIYALLDPTSGFVRYVGQTSRPVKRRLSSHFCDSRRGTTPPINAWLRGLAAKGERPTIWVIEEHETEDAGHESEIFWIGNLRSWGFDLLNMAVGGRVHRGWTYTAEQSAAASKRRTGMVPTWLHTPEVAAKMGASMKIRWESHVHPRKGVKHTDETKAKIKEGRAKNPPKISEEGKARTIAATKARWQSPENRAAWTAMMTKPDSQNAKRVARRAAREAAQPSLPLEKAA